MLKPLRVGCNGESKRCGLDCQRDSDQIPTTHSRTKFLSLPLFPRQNFQSFLPRKISCLHCQVFLFICVDSRRRHNRRDRIWHFFPAQVAGRNEPDDERRAHVAHPVHRGRESRGASRLLAARETLRDPRLELQQESRGHLQRGQCTTRAPERSLKPVSLSPPLSVSLCLSLSDSLSHPLSLSLSSLSSLSLSFSLSPSVSLSPCLPLSLATPPVPLSGMRHPLIFGKQETSASSCTRRSLHVLCRSPMS